MIDLADYTSGGYFLIRANKPEWIKSDLMPDKLLSLSECFCPRLGVQWGWTPGDREAALQFGIPENQLEEFLEWCGHEHRTEIAYPSMFFSLDAARRFIARFLPNRDGLYLIGAGLYHELAETKWCEEKIRPAVPDEGIKPQIDQHRPLADGGTPLGFEVVCFAYYDFSDSWLCSGLHEEMHELFGIRPGQFGLLQTREDAQKAHDWIAEDNQQGRRAEPYPYAYWLLVNYPLDG